MQCINMNLDSFSIFQKGIMAFFRKDSFIKSDITYNENYPLCLCFNIPNIDNVRINMRDIINRFESGISIVGCRDFPCFDETIQKDIKYRQLNCINTGFSEPHIIMPYIEVFSDIQECLTINDGQTTLISLFVKFSHRIQYQKLYELRKMLLSYKSLARRDIKGDSDYEFILCIERVFAMRKMSLTSAVAGSELSLDVQREGLINCIVYTLSVLYGSPDAFFYKNIPQEWKGADFNSYVYAHIKYLRKVKFLYEGNGIRLGDVIHNITTTIDKMWNTVHGDVMKKIEECKKTKIGCEVEGVYLTYDESTKRFRIEESNGTIIYIDDIMDLEMLKDTVPSYLPIVLTGTPDIISTTKMNNAFTVKTDDTTRVTFLGTSPKEGMFAMKTLIQSTSIFEVFEIMTEYFLSHIIHTDDRLKDIRKIIPRIYAIRNDIKFDNQGDLYVHKKRSAPCSIIMERKEGSTLHGICKYLSKEDLVKVLTSVFTTLDKLHKVLDFTHYDLHGGNIIVDTDTLDVSIIDTSRSIFRYNGMCMSRYFEENTMRFTGIMPDRSYPANDIFRLIMSCWSAGHTYLDAIIICMFAMDPSEVYGIYKHSIYSLDYNDKYKDITYEDVLNKLHSV